MPYIGSSPNFGAVESQTITTANGSTASFTLNQFVPDSDSIIVTVGNVVQEPTTAYSAVGTTITFTENVPNGDTIVIRYLGRSVDVPTTYTNINRFKFVATGGQNTFQNNDANGLELSYTAGNIDVFMNGVRLDESDFTASNGTSVVLVTNASASDEIIIIAYKSVVISNGLDKSSGGTVSGTTVFSGQTTFSGQAYFSGGIFGDVSFDSGTLKIDSGNNRVGIGTNSPTTQLHIDEADSNSYATIRLEGNNRGGDIEMYQGTVPVSTIRTDQSGNMYFKTSGAYGNSSVTTKFAIATAGNVGIGTDSPGTKLQIVNDTDTDYNISTATTNAVLNLKNNTSGTSNCVGMSFSTESNGEWFLTAVQESSTLCGLRFGARTGGSRYDRMDINSDGTVKIGLSTQPVAWGLRVYNNSGHATIQARNYNGGNMVFQGLNLNGSQSSTISESGVGYFANGVSSDETLKNVKGVMNDGWSKLKNIQPKSFTWKKIDAEGNKSDDDLDGNIHYGVMAQDLKKIIPDLAYGEEGGMSVDYNGLLMVAINTIKELEARIKALEEA